MRRRSLALLAAIATLFLFASVTGAAPLERTRVIVVLQDTAGNSSTAAKALGRQFGFEADLVYSHALNGFAAEVPSGRLDALRADARVASVELDQVAGIADQTVPTGIQRIFAPGNPNIDIDGLDDWRVDVDVAVIDTGIDLDHPDLNVFRSTNCSGGGPFKQSCGSGGDDDNNHGTHVAGTVAALDNGIGVVGVAPGARLWAVKVLSGSGSGYISWIVAGIDYVTANAAHIEVANMSLGCECSSAAMNTAIANSVAAGVTYAVAAGNSDKDAATFSPANHPDVITVSALADFDGAPGGVVGTSTSPPYCRVDQDDTLADFSNWGNRVEIAAPGVCILSTISGGGYATYSGTSMASPHVAGAAGLLASGSSTRTPVEIWGTLIATGNTGWTDESNDGAKEPLLDVSNTAVFAPALVAGSGGGGGTSDTTPPVISGVAPLNVTASSADISWTTDEVSDSVVRYGTSTPPGSSASDTALVTSHLVGLSGLTAATTYYYEVRSTDSSGNLAVDNNSGTYYSFTTAASSSGTTMHVGDLDGTTSLKGRSGKWEATITVTIHDSSHSTVANSTVSATWSGAKSGSVSGTTGSAGTLTFTTGAITGTSVMFTVNGVTHASLTYSGLDNHDPDVPVDSDGTSITVTR